MNVKLEGTIDVKVNEGASRSGFWLPVAVTAPSLFGCVIDAGQ